MSEVAPPQRLRGEVSDGWSSWVCDEIVFEDGPDNEGEGQCVLRSHFTDGWGD